MGLIETLYAVILTENGKERLHGIYQNLGHALSRAEKIPGAEIRVFAWTGEVETFEGRRVEVAKLSEMEIPRITSRAVDVADVTLGGVVVALARVDHRSPEFDPAPHYGRRSADVLPFVESVCGRQLDGRF